MSSSPLTKHSLAGRFAIARWLALIGLLLALLPAASAGAQSGGQATITVTSLADDGTPLPFSRFQIIDSAGELLTTRETEPPGGTVSIPIDLADPSLTYTVTMETPPACAVMPPDQTVGPLNDGDAVDLTFTTSFEDDCNLGSVSLYHYTCPEGFDASVDDYAYFRDNCLEADNGVGFTLAEAQDGGQSFPLTTGSYGIAGRAPIVGLLPGDYTVRQDDGDPGELLVYCLTFDGTPLEAPEPSDIFRADFNDDDKVAFELASRGRVACDFFAVDGAPQGDASDSSDDEDVVDDEPVDGSVNQNGDEGAEGAGVANASIEFHVATCPAGYDGSDYFNDCADSGTEGVEFTVVGQNTAYTDSETSTVPVSPGFGIAVISGLPADTYTMSEDVPGDVVSLFVYCADVPGGGPRIPTPENGSQEYDIELAAGQQVICDWFITPDQHFTPAILRLTLFTCEPGYGGSTFADFTGDCTEPTAGVFFNLSNGGGYDVDDDTNAEGKIRYTGLPPADSYLLTEDVPGDALENRVAYCASNGGDYIEHLVENGAIDLDPISDGDQVQCLWYDVPIDQNIGNGSVEIHKAECPAGTTGDFYARCHDDVVGGIGFELDGPGSVNDLGNTDDNGILRFTELPGGDYLISEIAPADYNVSVYAVFCTRDGVAFPTEYDDATGLRITFNLPAGANIICDWYNIPRGPAPTPTPAPGSAGGGSITVVKYACEDDAEDIRNFRDECEAAGAGIEFALTSNATGTTLSAETGTDGRIRWSGLANGAYDLDEVDGSWCKAESDRVDSNGNLLVENGGNTNVFIYNCGVDNVTVLPATGSGPAGSSFPLIGWLIAALAAIVTVAAVAAKPAAARRLG